MLIRKTSIVNALFVLAFPLYGLGNYLSFRLNFSAGIIISVSAFLAILLFFVLDRLYQGPVERVLNRKFTIGFLFTLSIAWSMWVAYLKHFPGLNLVNTASTSVMLIVPFLASVVVHVYNRANDGFDFAWLVLKGLLLLIAINLVGYAAGFRNLIHGFSGRINIPFAMGIYDASHLMSIINLMLLFYMKDFMKRPGRFLLLLAFFVVNLAVMLNVNSRLSLMIYLAVTVLFLTRSAGRIKGLYTISLFTMPLLMNFALLVYKILSLPVFTALLQRVTKEDVTTFNGRTYIWNAVADWVWDDRRGIIFGNGYRGQYQVRLLDFLAVLWNEKHSYNFHLHSTFLEILMDQGIVGLILFYMVIWYTYSFYRRKYVDGALESPLFAAAVYLMFIWQIDIFCSGMDIGNPLVFILFSMVVINERFITRKPRLLGGAVMA
ncbi:MAG: hypothetical protein KJZ58_07240 [Flavobacteriales bacterium]|nr:O-antigen ligase family protein [Flavobacteriales bacterium]MCL4282042.1 hypothetical protein [Flavobacteriales bacterium]